MDSKAKAGDTLHTFCKEFGVPEKLEFDGSKEQNMKNTELMKQIRHHNIDYNTTEKGYHNQNLAEGVIREIRWKWYRLMVRKRVPRPLWDYGMRWVTEIQALTYTEAGGICDTPLCHFSGDTPEISEYLDFGFYDNVWYWDNTGMGPRLPGKWLRVAHRVGRIMCYHVLTST